MKKKKKKFIKWIKNKTNSNINKPTVSDESQFHQPPHEPSWRDHQAPKKRAKKLIK